jgi:hypothetical protein
VTMRERLFSRGPAGAVVAGVCVVVLTLVAVAVIAVTTTRGSGGGEESAGTTPIAAAGTISPEIALFGDTVDARIDVTLDRTQIDPRLVHAKAAFAPWLRVGTPVVERHDSGDTTFLRWSYVLRCLDSACVPSRGPLKFDFNPAKVSYLSPQGDATERLVVDAHWPALLVHSRLDAADATQRDPLRAPWHADLTSLPAVTYRIGPWSLVVVLLAAGIAFLVAAAILFYRLLPERREVIELPPPPPKPVLSPLEQALVLLEAHATEDGVAERRRALELVAEELAGWDERSLERRARTLAWSEDEPAPAATQALAAMVRAQLEGRSNGRPA